FQYSARMLGYRQLRSGLLIGFHDHARALVAQLPEMTNGGWYEFTRLVPDDLESAKRLTAIAFDLDCARTEIESLEAELALLAGEQGRPGTGLPELPIGRFFDLYFRVGRAVMENPLLPVDLVGEEQPSQRFRAVMDRCNLE
ncbi:PaaX family transcriptional regulator, partial [Burkholderia multivorans]